MARLLGCPMADSSSIWSYQLKSRYLISLILSCVILQVSSSPKVIERNVSRKSEGSFAECPASPVVTISDYNIEKGGKCDGDLDLLVEVNWNSVESKMTCGAVVLKCQSSQPIAWQYHGPGKLDDFQHAFKSLNPRRTLAGPWNENATRWCYEVIIELNQLSMYSSMAGRYTCGELMAQEQGQSSQNSTYQQLQWKNDSNNASIYFYGELSKPNEKPKNLEVSPTPSNLYEVVIPCGPKSSPDSFKKWNPRTAIFEVIPGDRLEIKFYPPVGFHVRGKLIEDILGTYTCHEDNVTTTWTVDKARRNSKKFTQSNDISIEYEEGCFKCSGKNWAKIIECKNPFHCNLLAELAKNDLKPGNLNCPSSSGLAICIDGDKYQIFEFVKFNETNLARPPMEVKMSDRMRQDNRETFMCINDTVRINCLAPKYAFSNEFQLLAEFKNGSKVVANEMVLDKSGDIGNINGYYHQKWKVNVTSKDIIKYICIAPRLRSSGWGWNATANVTIIDAIPTIIIKNLSSPSQVQFYATDTNFEITCAAGGVPEPYDYDWFKDGEMFSRQYNGTVMQSTYSIEDVVDGMELKNYSIKFTAGKNAPIDINGTWTCNISNGHGPRAIHNISVTILPKPSGAPQILQKESSELHKEFFKNSTNFNISCGVKGDPKPQVKWYKDGQLFNFTDGNGVVTHSEIPRQVGNEAWTEHVLKFSSVADFDLEISGIWTCNASNGEEPSTSRNIEVYQRPEAIGTDVTFWIAGGLIGFIVLLLVAVLFGYAYFRLQKKLTHMTSKELEAWLHGNRDLTDDPNILKDGRRIAANLPYQQLKYELKPENIKRKEGKPSKKGEFAIVMPGELTPVDGFRMDVAIKKPNDEDGVHKFLLGLKASKDELKIYQYIQCIGEHEYVLKLVGAVTSQIEYGKLQVVLEYCEFSMEEYLQLYGTYIHNEIRDEKIIYSGIHSDTVNVARTTDTGIPQHYVELSFKKFTTTDLIMWTYQIACGMAHLTSLNIVHRDLAARNVLLKKIGKFLVVKIADFGISIINDTENTNIQIGNFSENLPWRHLAPELFVGDTSGFCEATDVWAFGITMWEMFSVAAKQPYDGLEWSPETQAVITNKIKSGFRNPKPKYSNEEIYDIMCECWALEPSERPTFEQLSERLFQLLPEEYKATIPEYVFKPHKEVTLDDLQPLVNATSSFELEPETNDRSQRSVTFIRECFPGVVSWK